MSVRILQGDALTLLRTLPAESVNCCVTSPPFWGLRDYGMPGQIGLERTPGDYVLRLVEVMGEVRRVLRSDGTAWVNLGDSYTSGNRKERDAGRIKIHPAYVGENFKDGLRPPTPEGLERKDLVGIPWRVAFALQAAGWYLRCDVIWKKRNAMPESVQDRPTRNHEYVFLLAKNERYYYDAAAIREPWADHRQGRDRARAPSERNRGGRTDGFTKPNGIDPSANGGRNRRSVWDITTEPYHEGHFATFPPRLPLLCILAGCPEGGTVLDPFAGSGTVGMVAERIGRHSILMELNPKYIRMIQRRTAQRGLFA